MRGKIQPSSNWAINKSLISINCFHIVAILPSCAAFRVGRLLRSSDLWSWCFISQANCGANRNRQVNIYFFVLFCFFPQDPHPGAPTSSRTPTPGLSRPGPSKQLYRRQMWTSVRGTVGGSGPGTENRVETLKEVEPLRTFFSSDLAINSAINQTNQGSESRFGKPACVTAPTEEAGPSAPSGQGYEVTLESRNTAARIRPAHGSQREPVWVLR